MICTAPGPGVCSYIPKVLLAPEGALLFSLWWFELWVGCSSSSREKQGWGASKSPVAPTGVLAPGAEGSCRWALGEWVGGAQG